MELRRFAFEHKAKLIFGLFIPDSIEVPSFAQASFRCLLNLVLWGWKICLDYWGEVGLIT